MLRHPCALLAVILLTATAFVCADPVPLLHYDFDQEPGRTVIDRSPHCLDGDADVQWVPSPVGNAVLLDGEPDHVVRVTLPPQLRFGKDSWTFMAWIKPTRLTIDAPQNQRRLFSFGIYPDAIIVIDLLHNGTLDTYQCYRGPDGKVIDAGTSSALTNIAIDQWAHVAVVCDRQARTIRPYINGFCARSADIDAGFDGDFTLGGELTIGNIWHNYWGMVDDVRVYRQALPSEAIDSVFERGRTVYDVKEPPQMLAIRERLAAERTSRAMQDAWRERRFADVRRLGLELASPHARAEVRSYALLRTAQSHVAEGHVDLARQVYEQVKNDVTLPPVHRSDAEQRLAELDRTARGLPVRDSAAGRVQIPAIDRFAAEVFVAVDAAPGGDGSRRRPLASLLAARDAVRVLRARGEAGPIAVTLLPGRYAVTSTLHLTAEDSGHATGPTVYRAEQPGQTTLDGGTRLHAFSPVTDPAIRQRLPEQGRDRVLQCSLPDHGITSLGELRVRGYAQPPAPPTLELHFNQQPMTLARWPNEGFVAIRRLVQPGARASGEPSVFEYEGDRPSRWTTAPDPWIFGYFRYLWADATLPIARIDPQARTITTGQPYHYDGGGMSTDQGIIYYAFNLLEELDSPGEWYLDRQSGMLYFLPPADPADAIVEINLLDAPMLAMKQVSHVRIENLVFDLGRVEAINLNDCQHCLLAGCTVRRFAGDAVNIVGGEACGVLSSDVHTLGRGAIHISGGERRTLRPGGHFVENCHIHHVGRIDRTYTPAVLCEGVGQRVAHNLMTHAPSSVMRIEGNDHLIELNDVRDAVQESDDQGAMELYGNPTYRGVIFRYNRFRDIGKTGTETSVHGQASIRLDDVISGMTIHGNIFIRGGAGRFGAVQINAGRDNLIDANVFLNCRLGVTGGWYPGNKFWQVLADGKPPASFITGDLYRARYPLIAHMLDDPGINHLWRNLFVRCGPALGPSNQVHLDLLGNVVSDEMPGATAGADITPLPEDLMAVTGIPSIPVAEIGLYRDTYRR